MSDPIIQDLARQVTVLEERMNTRQAEYKTDIARLAEQLAKRDADRDIEAAKRDAEAAKRDAEAAKRDADRDTEAAKRDAEAAKRDTDRDTEAARRDTEAARRETRIILAVFGMIAVATAILGFLIRLPNPAS